MRHTRNHLSRIRPGTGRGKPQWEVAVLLSLVVLAVSPPFRDAGAADYPSTRVGPGIAGEIHAAAYDEVDPNRIYVGGDVGGVFRTTDHGSTWESWSDGLQDPSNGKPYYVDDLLAVGETIWAATWDGIYSRPRTGAGPWQSYTEPTEPRENYSFYHVGTEDGQFGRAIPFSSLVHDAINNVLYAGAGHGRDMHTQHFYPNITTGFVPFTQSPPQQYALWRKDLGQAGTWTPVDGTQNKGLVRQVAVRNVGGVILVVFASTDSEAIGGNGSIYSVRIDGAQITVTDIADDYVAKNSPPEIEWSGNSWGVAFGSGNFLYALQRTPDDDLLPEDDRVPGVWAREFDATGFFGPWIWVGDPGDTAYVPPHSPANGETDPNFWWTWTRICHENVEPSGPEGGCLTSVDRCFDLTSLTVRQDAGLDEVYVGERRRTQMGGYYRCKLTPGAVLAENWVHILSVNPHSHWNGSPPPPFEYRRLDSAGNPVALDVGWLDNLIINPTVPLIFHPTQRVHMLAHMYHVPLVTTNGGGTWAQMYCDGAPGSWHSRGINQMYVKDFAFRPNGDLVVGGLDFGCFRRTVSGPEQDDFTWLNWWATSAPSSALKKVGTNCVAAVEVMDDVLYAVRGGYRNDVLADSLIATCSNWSGGQVASDPWDFTTVMLNLTTLFTGHFKVIDIKFASPDTLFAAIQQRLPGDCWQSAIYRGVLESQVWTWAQHCPFVGKRYHTLLRLPGTHRILVAATSGGCGGHGGVYCFLTGTAGIPETWLEGAYDQGWPAIALSSVTAMATDSQGWVVYVGTSGAENYRQNDNMTTGTVLRVTGGPFRSKPQLAEWAVLANENGENTFGFDPHFYHSHDGGSTAYWEWTYPEETARRMTQIGALAVDPNDPRICYAGMRARHSNPANGVWRYDERWEHIVGGGERAMRGVSALAFDPGDPTHRTLYVGTDGEEIFKVTVPEVTPVSKSRFVKVPRSVTQLNYQGTPYSSIPLDYDNDGNDDLMISIQEPGLYSQLYRWLSKNQNGEPIFGQPFDAFAPGSTPQGGLRGLAAADFNNDAKIDFFAAAETFARLYCNNYHGEGKFADVASTTGVAAAAGSSWCGAWGDYDNDGLVDLFIGTAAFQSGQPPTPEHALPVQDRLLRNTVQGEATLFQDVSTATGIAQLSTTCLSASWADIERDGDTDLFVGNLASPSPENHTSVLCVNTGAGAFQMDQTANRFPAASPVKGISGAAWGDMDNDGDLDLCMSSQAPVDCRPWVLFNTGTGYFNGGDALRLPVSAGTVGVRMFDQNLDGRSDLLLLPWEASESLRLFLNGEGGALVDNTEIVGLTTLGTTLGAVAADFTNDGDCELYLGRPSGGDEFFYRTTTWDGADPPARDWVKVRLDPGGNGAPNAAAIGAQVTVQSGSPPSWQQTQIVDGGSSRGGQAARTLLFGLPEGEDPVSAVVYWPTRSSKTVTLNRNAVNVIVDDADPNVVPSSVSFSYQVVPGGGNAEWTFTWDTEHLSWPQLDEVTIEYRSGAPSVCSFAVGTLTAATPGVTIRNEARAPDGPVQHWLSWVTDCAKPCSYYYTVRSQNQFVVSEGPRKVATVSVCPGNPMEE